ncbi:PAS domain-containing protein [Desulfobulbus sp.]
MAPPPVGVLIVNDREEVIAANPPAGQIFDLSPQAAMEAA